MGKYIFATINNGGADKIGGAEISGLFTAAELAAELFDPDVEPLEIIPLTIGGGTYAERKARARALAISIQAADVGGLSYGESAILGYFFAAAGRRYGLLREFRENAIC